MSKDTALGSNSLDSVQSLTLTSYVAKLRNSFNDLICEMGMIIHTYLIGLLRGPKEFNVCVICLKVTRGSCFRFML